MPEIAVLASIGLERFAMFLRHRYNRVLSGASRVPALAVATGSLGTGAQKVRYERFHGLVREKRNRGGNALLPDGFS
jgi:hypothetical protein